MKVIAAIRNHDGGTMKVVLFRGKDADGAKGEVALSRAGGSCLYPLSTLQAHDGHAPSWFQQTEPEEANKGIGELPGYIKRVLSDVAEVIGKPPKVVEVHVIEDDGMMLDEPTKFENLVQAIEAAVGADGHRGIVLVW